MRHPSLVSGRLAAAAVVAGALLGGGLITGCQQSQSPQPGGQTSGPTAAASPAAPTAAVSPAAPAGGAGPATPPTTTAQASPPAGGATTGAAGGGVRPPATPASIQAGRQLFEQNCASCHGPKAKGDGPAAVALNPKPQNLTDKEWKHGGSPQQIFQTITNGAPGTAMVSWAALSEQDRWNLVSFILSLQGT